jgi:hypothetical protein
MVQDTKHPFLIHIMVFTLTFLFFLDFKTEQVSELTTLQINEPRPGRMWGYE